MPPSACCLEVLWSVEGKVLMSVGSGTRVENFSPGWLLAAAEWQRSLHVTQIHGCVTAWSEDGARPGWSGRTKTSSSPSDQTAFHKYRHHVPHTDTRRGQEARRTSTLCSLALPLASAGLALLRVRGRARPSLIVRLES